MHVLRVGWLSTHHRTAAVDGTAAAGGGAPAAGVGIDLTPYESEEQLLFKGPGADALKAALNSMGLKW